MPDKDEFKKRFIVNIYKQYPHEWSLGMNITHSWDNELYLLVHLFKWNIAIGYMYNYRGWK